MINLVAYSFDIAILLSLTIFHHNKPNWHHWFSYSLIAIADGNSFHRGIRRSKWHQWENKQVSTAQMPTKFVFEVLVWIWHSPFLLIMNATAPLNHSHICQSTLCTLTVAAVCDMSMEWAWIANNWSRSGLPRSGTSEPTPIWTKMSPEVFQLFYSNIYLSPIGILVKVCRLIDRYRS